MVSYCDLVAVCCSEDSGKTIWVKRRFGFTKVYHADCQGLKAPLLHGFSFPAIHNSLLLDEAKPEIIRILQAPPTVLFEHGDWLSKLPPQAQQSSPKTCLCGRGRSRVRQARLSSPDLVV